ncbi:uncharacterized protein CEXT_126821 [Caerostris extrusa]|uniref:Uncharacterized protein n=1 Tax=Caerostris extrusa TaxID=172846 RepID=A0AAV4YAT0_CAEEX|nr:uncharacterized protein CEXT_126821 [Caerostris extrusa]
METSEQCDYDSSVDTPDSSSLTSELVICKADNNTEEIISQTQSHEVQLCDQIVGYIDETNSTLVLQAPVVGSDGKSAVLAEGNEGDEVLLILDPEDPGRYSENCIVNSTIEIQSESVSQEIVRSDVIQTIQLIPADDSGETLYIQQPCEFTLVDSENNYISTENITEIAGHAEFKDGSFVEIECPTSIHEGYVIFKETISLSNSSDVANFTLHTDNVNDDEKHSSHEDANDEILSTQKHPTSSHQRVVSVIHAPLSMNNSDNNLENSIESSSVSEECNKKDTFTVEKNQIEKNDYSKEVFTIRNITYKLYY